MGVNDAHAIARNTRDFVRFARSRAWTAAPGTLNREAAAYWNGGAGSRFADDSHWASGSNFAHSDLWSRMGAEHLALYERMRRSSSSEPAKVRHVVDWGCGGGANAVEFASIAERVTGVDISQASLDECARQMKAASPSVPFRPVLATDVAQPEDAAREAGPCELVICIYVLELVPSPTYGLRLLRVFRDMLTEGGQVFVQVKYATGWRTASRRRSYQSDLAGITYRADEFWTAADGLGLRPEGVVLVPRNELDERYAYFLLTRP